MPKQFSFRNRIKSFSYALYGIRYTIKTQHNFTIHLVSAILAIFLGFILDINHFEWIIIVIVIGLVLCLEILNTAIEKLVDIVMPEKDIRAGLIKDLSAGAVLIVAVVALICGIIIFLPKILEFL